LEPFYLFNKNTNGEATVIKVTRFIWFILSDIERCYMYSKYTRTER